MSKVFTVFGATGQQGGSIIRCIQANETLRKQYTLRGVTRDPNSGSSKKLKDLGVEVVKADLNDANSVKQAIAGSAVVFGVTNAWDSSTGHKEADQGKAIADAAAATGAELFIWSSLPNKEQIDKTSGTSNIKRVPHFDSKAEVEEYTRKKLPKLPATYVLPGFFFENYLSQLMQPQQVGDSLVLHTPFDPTQTKLALYTPKDMGTYVSALLLAPRESILNKQWFAISDILTPLELKEAISKGKGQKIELKPISVDEYKTFLPEAMRDEIGANMELIRDPGYYGSEKAARDGYKAFHDLIQKTKAGKLTTAVEFYKAAYSN